MTSRRAPRTIPTATPTSNPPLLSPRRTPTWVRLATIVTALVGIVFFLFTLSRLRSEDAIQQARQLGVAAPWLVLPSLTWHLLRTWGWGVAFPDGVRPAFTRLFRVRLAADAISFFTVRGPTGEPLKVLLLSDRVSPAVATASIATERLAFALVSVILAGAVAQLAVHRLPLTPAWDVTFRLLSVGAVAAVAVFGLVVRRGSSAYLGTRLRRWPRVAGHPWLAAVVTFIGEVERHVLGVLRGARRRLLVLTILPLVCYALNAFEVWLIFAVIGEPITATTALVIETFVRLASVAGAAVPASLGTLEASHAAVAAALDLSGGGALALVRRLRALLWAGLGLAVYPRLNGATSTATPDAGS